MNYAADRNLAADIVRDLISNSLLDPCGGALSMRLTDGNILISPTGSALGRWALKPSDFVIITPEGEFADAGRGYSAAQTPLFLAIHARFAKANVIVHSHSEWSLVYAALGATVPPTINGFRRLGDVPCIICFDKELKERYRAEPWDVPYPPSMVRRPDVAAVSAFVERNVIALFADRESELDWHSLAFTLYRHGVVVFGPNVEQTFDDVSTVEANAATAYRVAMLTGAAAPEPAKEVLIGPIPGWEEM